MKHILLKGKKQLIYQNKSLHFHHQAAQSWPEFPVKFVGICHSDRSFTSNPSILPLVLGHEIVCYEKTDNHLQYYAVCNEIYCKKCQYCSDGNFSHCENLIELGVNEHGGYAEFIKVPKEYLLPVYFNNPKMGILVEPLSCVLHGFHRIQILLPLLQAIPIKIMIVGCGVIGKMFAHLLIKTNRSNKIYLYDINPATMALFGSIENTILVQKPTEATMDIVIECSGATDALESCDKFVRKGGIIFLFGLYHKKAKLPLPALVLLQKELTISTSFAGSQSKISGSSMMKEARGYIMVHQYFFETLLGKTITLEKAPEEILHNISNTEGRTLVELPSDQQT